MPWGFAIAAAGAIGGALINSSSASNASNAQSSSDQAAIAEQAREFNKTQSNEAPSITTGTSALDTLANIYGLSTYAPGKGNAVNQASAANPNGGSDYSSFYESPDYQFALSQGEKGVDAGAAAGGTLDSGATRKAEISYAGNLASQNFNQYADRLQSLAGVAQTGDSTEAAVGTNTANQVSSLLQNQGNNLASSYLAQGSAYGNAIGQLGGIAQSYYNQQNPFGSANADAGLTGIGAAGGAAAAAGGY